MSRLHPLQRTCRHVIFNFEKLEPRWLQAAQTSISLADLPTLATALQPASHPVLPADFDTFAPRLGTSAVTGTPTVAEWTRSGSAGDSLVVTADQLSDSAAGTIADTQFVAYGETTPSNGIFTTATVSNATTASAEVTLGSTLPADSMYLLWPGNGQGFGAPVAVNKADAWWVGPDAASAGQSVSVFGQNLTLGGEINKAAVYLEPGPGNTAAARWVPVTNANPYKLTIQLPTDLPSGNWQVWAHNGHGGEDGWSAPVSLIVHSAQTWSGPVFNVKDYGATGDGVTDDHAAISAAIAAAQAIPGSTVYLPAGTYMINSGLDNMNGIRIVGQSTASTIIEAGPAWTTVENYYDTFHECLIFSPGSGTAFSNFTLSANNNYAGADLPDLVYARSMSDVTFTNVDFDAQQFAPVDLNGSTRVLFEGCNLTGDTSFLGTASQLFFDQCNFYMTNDALAALYTWGGNEISLTNNTCQDLDPSDPNNGAGWGLGRFICGNSMWGGGEDIYIGSNTTMNLGTRSGYSNQNNGEQIAWEGTVTNYDGAALGGTSTTVNVKNYTGTAVSSGFVVAIVAGKGVGQVRDVQSSSGSTVTLQTAWNVVPDVTSKVVLETLPHNIVVYGNTLGGKSYIYSTTSQTASTGVEMFQGASQVIVDDNTFHNIGLGVGFWAGPTDYDVLGEVNPVMFTSVANNTFTGVVRGILWSRDASDDGTPFIGNLLRSNTITGTLLYAFDISTSANWASQPGIPDTNVVENTTTDASDAEQFIHDDASYNAAGILMQGNTFDSTDYSVAVSAVTTVIVADSSADLSQDAALTFTVLAEIDTPTPEVTADSPATSAVLTAPSIAAAQPRVACTEVPDIQTKRVQSRDTQTTNGEREGVQITPRESSNPAATSDHDFWAWIEEYEKWALRKAA